MRPKLNGWRRLWVVLTVSWTLVVGLYGYRLWPGEDPLHGGTIDEKSNPQMLPKIGDEVPPQVGPDIVIIDDNGTEHVFPPGSDPKRAAAIVRQQLAERRLQLRRRFTAQLLGASIFPAAVLYALGWSVGWVRRGFANS
jgi:hypothetical protein